MRVLIADDDRPSRRMLSRLLEKESYEVLEAEDGAEAWEVITRERDRLRLVVVDWMMPGLTGLELLRKIRSADFSHYVYTILLTSRSDQADRNSGLAEGADDYVVKPFDSAEFKHRVRSGKRVVKLQVELEEKRATLEKMVKIDGLTGIQNRRAFDEGYQELIHATGRHNRSFAILMIDIDNFKPYNDRFGHAAGDLALRRVATLLEQHLRGIDRVYRYGGEEFTCLLPETSMRAARSVAERLRAVIANEGIAHPDSPTGHISVSIGVSAFEEEGPLAAGQVLETADRALYVAKKRGRNRVCLPLEFESEAPAR